MTCKCRKKVLRVQHTERCQSEQGTVTITRPEADALRDLLEYVRQGWVGPHAQTIRMLRGKVAK
jgi:hypothetical protein